MEWHDWTDVAFERARERETPVLLYLRAGWCQWCRELEELVLADERVVRALDIGFVCIRVDKDRRPDLDERYRRGGWPTLAWLDARGELLAADNYLDADALLERMERVRAHYPEGRAEIAAGATGPGMSPSPALVEPLVHAGARPRGRHPRELSPEVVDDVARTLIESADPVYGGWGTRQKFPHPEALHFAIVRWSQTGDPQTLSVVLRTLRCMQRGEIYDEVEGGFYRYATQPDWSVPHHEKMLDSNAQRLIAYVEAFQAVGEASFEWTARGILDWMHETLLDPQTRAFRGSQDADPEYAHLRTREARRARGAPECDPTIFCNWNAMAARSLLKSAVVLGEDRYRLQALATLDFLVENLWDERRGMYHYWDGTYNLPGMLTDQAYMLRALIEAMHYSGENRYLVPALQLARFAVEHLQGTDGFFYDAHEDPNARRPLGNRSILENAVMSEALLRLAQMAREPELTVSARACLDAFLPEYKAYGHFIAAYGRAVDLLFNAPVHVTIVGSRAEDKTRALREAALRPYVANRIVQTIDPREDATLFELAGLPDPGERIARAYIHQGRASYAETSQPARLPALMARAERSD